MNSQIAQARRHTLSRGFWALIILLPILWWAAEATRYRTHLEIESNGTSVRFGVDGQWLQLPLELGGLKHLRLRVARAFFPTNYESLVLKAEQGEAQILAVPPRFTRLPSTQLLTGDWWADRGCEPELVFEQEIKTEGAFTLSAVTTGRTLEANEIILEGEHQTCRMFYRGGHLSNDMGFIGPEGIILAESRAGRPGRDWYHFSHHIISILFWGGCWITMFRLWGRFGPNFRGAAPRWISWERMLSVILCLGFCISIWVALWVMDAIAHFQDDVGYLLRAKWLLSGQLILPVPPHQEHFAIPFTSFTPRGWISQYTLGWPLLLALGQAVGMPWVIGPLCGLALGYFTWRVGREAGGKAVGCAAVALGIVSPLGQLLAGSLMSHTATAMCLALFIWLYIVGWRSESRGERRLLLAGISLGFAFCIRPLSAVAVMLPAAVYGLAEMYRLGFQRKAWLGLAAVFTGGLIGASLQLVDNFQVTGSPWLFAYTVVSDPGWSLTNYKIGTYLSEPLFALMPGLALGWGWPFPSLVGWLSVVGVGLGAVVFLTRQANRVDWLLLGICGSVALAYMGYGGTGLHGFGPRYLADVFFAGFILIARGAQTLSNGPTQVRSGKFIMAGTLSVFCCVTLVTLPKRFSYYRGYNESDHRVENIIRQAGIERALILLVGADHIMWARVSRLLPVDLRDDLVFACWKEDNRPLVEAYSDRPVYVISDEGLQPYTEALESTLR